MDLLELHSKDFSPWSSAMQRVRERFDFSLLPSLQVTMGPIGHDCILHSIPTNSFLYSCIHIALGECAVVVGRGAAGINYLRLHHQGKG